MKFKTLLRLIPWGFCAWAGVLSAQDAAEAHRNEQLQAAFTRFPLLEPLTNSAGVAEFQTLDLKNPVVIDDQQHYGFRFTVPSRAHEEDLALAFVAPASDNFEWEIIPEKGTMPGLTNFLIGSKGVYTGTNILVPLNENRLILQNISGKTLKDGETYLIWMTLDGKPPAMSLEFAFAPMGTNVTDQRAAIKKALGLVHPYRPAFVNPGNHHTYILLNQSTWATAEAQAVALGGHLATVRNQAEEEWLVKTFGSYGGAQRLLWIGLSDRDKKFHFAWSSGESVSYTCWAPGEPNNAGRGEDFVAIFYPKHKEGGKWNDWGNRNNDPVGLSMNGVAEIIPKEKNAPPLASSAQSPTPSVPGANNPSPGPSVSTSASPEVLQAVNITPALIITNDSGSIKLQWPISKADYMLEATTNLSEQFKMFGYSELTNAEAGVVYVTITNPVPQMFFRLRKP